MILPTIAPIAVPPSLDEPGEDVGPAEVEPVDEPVGPVREVMDNDVGDVVVDDVGVKVEEGVELVVELDVVDDTVVLGGGVGPP